jgi:uncharacterized membrane protein YgcG
MHNNHRIHSNRGIGGAGAVAIAIMLLGCVFLFISITNTNIMKHISDTYEYRGTFTSEASAEDGIDIFASSWKHPKVKVEIESYKEPFVPAQLNSQIQYVMNYKDCVVVVSPREAFETYNVSLNPQDRTVIAIYPPEAAESEYNDGMDVYVRKHHGYDPYYYRRHRHSYVSVHFRGGYRRFYGRRRSVFGFRRSSGSGRGYGSRSFRSGGSSYGK